MKKISLLKDLERYPLFTFNEFVRLFGGNVGYAKTYLYRMRKEKLIFEIERGKYTVFDNPLIFSSYILVPSYISFWSAFRFYNFTEQLPRNIMIASPKQKKTLDFHGTKIFFYKTQQFWGYKKQRYERFDIFVAEKEKAIIDSLLIKNTPFDEIVKAIETKDFDIKKLIEYTIKSKNKSLIKRVGYLMEYFGFDSNKLTKYIDNNYIVLDSSSKRKGRKNRKWKIVINGGFDDRY